MRGSGSTGCDGTQGFGAFGSRLAWRSEPGLCLGFCLPESTRLLIGIEFRVPNPKTVEGSGFIGCRGKGFRVLAKTAKLVAECGRRNLGFRLLLPENVDACQEHRAGSSLEERM